MPTYLFRLSCRSRRLLLALLLAFSGSLFAQGLSVAPLPQPSSLEPEQTAVNVASIEPLPRAPGNATCRRALVPWRWWRLPLWSHGRRSSRCILLGPRESCPLYGCGRAGSSGLLRDPRESDQWRERTESRDSRVQRQHSGARDKLIALETASTIGISYMFHKTGHHKLERITSFVNIGTSAGAVAYGLTHR